MQKSRLISRISTLKLFWYPFNILLPPYFITFYDYTHIKEYILWMFGFNTYLYIWRVLRVFGQIALIFPINSPGGRHRTVFNFTFL